MPGVNGHAGLLATADDVAKLAVAYLRAARDLPAPGFALAPQTVRAMTAPRYVGDGEVRALGWDVDSFFSRNRGETLPRGGFGHTGSSGTSIWIDPATDLAIVFASNAHYPDDKGGGHRAARVGDRIGRRRARALRSARRRSARRRARAGRGVLRAGGAQRARLPRDARPGADAAPVTVDFAGAVTVAVTVAFCVGAAMTTHALLAAALAATALVAGSDDEVVQRLHVRYETYDLVAKSCHDSVARDPEAGSATFQFRYEIRGEPFSGAAPVHRQADVLARRDRDPSCRARSRGRG